MRRPPTSLIFAAVVLLAGLAGLVRGALPQSVATASSSSTATADPIVVGGAYIREPANGVNAATYFTVYNTTDAPDELETVVSGAGAETSIHTENSDGGMQMDSGGLTVPAHGSLALSPAKGHAMIEKLYGPLKAGESVNLELTFAKAGVVLVVAPVIAITAPAPTAAAPK